MLEMPGCSLALLLKSPLHLSPPDPQDDADTERLLIRENPKPTGGPKMGMQGLVGINAVKLGLLEAGHDVGINGWRSTRRLPYTDFQRVKQNLENAGFLVEPDYKLKVEVAGRHANQYQ